MKPLIIILIIFSSISAFAQDSITLKNGGTKEVKITDIRDGYIEFYMLNDSTKKVLKVPVANVVDFHQERGEFNLTDTKVIDGDVREIYCAIVGTEKFLSNKVIVGVDFGQESKFMTPYLKTIIDPETGKAREFDSMVDALNFMSTEHGWTFATAYSVTIGNSNVYRWLLKKKVRLSE